jgi:hypothetical protein
VAKPSSNSLPFTRYLLLYVLLLNYANHVIGLKISIAVKS